MSILKKIKDKTGTIHDLGDSRVDAFETELSGAEHNVPYSPAVLAKTNAIEANVSAHIGNTANPHKVTKAQIGLANVENKSSTQIRSELTKENVTNALGYTPIDESRIGAANGVASLDASGRIPASQIPGGFDNIEEYDNLAAFPTTGEEGKIYVAKDTNLTYRWTGSQYVEISPSLALGETATTAYRGDRGKVAYTHSQVSGNSTIHHTHANKELLDTYKQTEADLANAVSKVHEHGNKSVLDGITSDKVNSWDGKEDAFDVLPTTKGGTGTNAASKSALTSTLINSLSTESSTPSDADYYVSQYAGGGTSNTSFVRKPVFALWTYIKSKISSVLGLTDSAYSGKAATAGTADKAVADNSGNNIEETYATKTETEEAISNSVDQTYSSTSTKAQSGVAVNEAFKTRETSTSDDSYTYLGMTLKGPSSTEKLYWKLVSFKPTASYWTLQFEIDVSNGRKGEKSFDSSIYETKRLTIYSDYKDTVRNAIELRYTSQSNTDSRGYGNNIYYEMDSSGTVTIYIYTNRTANTAQICRLTSLRNFKDISNITWYKPVVDAGTQPTNPIKFKEDFPAIASKTSNIGSDSVPVYVNNGKPVSCNSSNLKAGKDDDGNVIKNTYQKKLTFDTKPTAGSTNPVTSDGIKTALNNYVTITKSESSNFHVKNNEYYSFICRTNISNWEKIQADFFCPSSDSSTVGKLNIFATLSTTDTSLHTPERVAEFGGIVWDYNYKGYNTIKYRIYVAKSGDNFYFYAKRNSSNDKSLTAFRSRLLYTTSPGLTDNVSADLDDATWQTLSLVEMKNVYSSTTQERLDSHTNDTTVHITLAERKAWNAKQSALDFDDTPTSGSTNPVTSEGIKTALEVLQSNIDTADAKGIVINEIDGENVICFE